MFKKETTCRFCLEHLFTGGTQKNGYDSCGEKEQAQVQPQERMVHRTGNERDIEDDQVGSLTI